MTQQDLERQEAFSDAFQYTEDRIRTGIAYLCVSVLLLGALLFIHQMVFLGVCAWWAYTGQKHFQEGRRLRVLVQHQWKLYAASLEFRGHYRVSASQDTQTFDAPWST